MKEVAGVAASPGACVAPALLVRKDDLELPVDAVEDIEGEVEALRRALESVAEGLEKQAAEAEGELAEVLDAQAMMARDPELAEEAAAAVTSHGTPAPRAVIEAGEVYAAALEASDNEYMAARAADIRDVCSRVARVLTGAEVPDLARLDRLTAVVARDLAPADIAGIDAKFIAGFATEQGSRTSHTAIVARALGIPAVVAAGDLLLTVADGTLIGIDGDSGVVHVDPDSETAAALNDRAARRARARKEVAGSPSSRAATSDLHAVELAANVANIDELRAARDMGVDAVGLWRTELFYFDRTEPPGIDEQSEMIAAMADLLGGGRLVIRTFDFGADKPLPFLKLGTTSESALGIRGIRLAMAQPELLDDQLAAIARAATPERRLAVMAPMVATLEEADWFRERVVLAGLPNAGVEVGVMIEVPAAVLQATELAERLDFLSIGTNDLAQYLHAADRREGALAAMQDPFSPALLRAVKMVCDCARGKAWVGVCGEAASEPAWALAAVGLGVSELSMSAASVVDIQFALEQVTLEDCRTAVQRALEAPDAKRARASLMELM